MTIDSDEALFVSFIAGDRTAFDTLHARYRDVLKKFVRTRYFPRHDATCDDVVQQSFLMICGAETQAKFNPRRAFRPWFFSLAANLAIDAQHENAA